MGQPATLKVDIIADASKAAQGVSKAERAFGGLGAAAKKMGGALAAAAVATGVISFARDAVKAGSDVQQSFGALEFVFKRNAKVMKKWARNAATQYGLSASEAAQMAAIVGAQLKGMGFDLRTATGMTQKLTGRAADLAATFGGTTQQALEAISALLRGERDPIERYGVSIKDADIKARLAAEGLSNLTGSAKTNAEAQAALQILFAKTGDSAGAFGKQTNTLAEQQQILHAQFQNVKAAIGEALIPALTALYSWINTKVIPTVKLWWQWFQVKILPTLQNVWSWIQQRLVIALQALWSWIQTKVVPAIGAFWQWVQTRLIPTLQQWWAWIQQHVLPVLAALWAFLVNKLIPSIRSGLLPAVGLLIWAFGQVDQAVHKTLDALHDLGIKDKDVVRVAQFIMQWWGRSVVVAFTLAAGAIAGIAWWINQVAGLIHNLIDAVKSLIDWLGRIKVPSIKIPHIPGTPIGRSAVTAGPLYAAPAARTATRAPAPTVVVNVSGAIDPESVARQISRILSRHGVRVGTAVAV